MYGRMRSVSVNLIDQESLNADVLNSPLFPEPPNSDVDDLVKHYNTVMG